MGIEPKTSRVLLRRCVLYRCAATAAQRLKDRSKEIFTRSNESVVVELVVDGVPHARARVARWLLEKLLLRENIFRNSLESRTIEISL